MNINKITTKTIVTYEITFERYDYTVTLDYITKDEFHFSLKENGEEVTNFDLRFRILNEISKVIG